MEGPTCSGAYSPPRRAVRNILLKRSSILRIGDRREDAVAAARGVVGVAVIGVEDGFTATLNGDERFPMASTFKVPIALAVLHRVDEGALSLAEPVEVKATDLRDGGMETINHRFRTGGGKTL